MSLDGPLDFTSVLVPVRRGGLDLCMRLAGDECIRATRTPDGPATVALRATATTVEAEAWGPGATWALDHVPDLVGQRDDAGTFEPRSPFVADLHRRNPGLRIGRTLAVAEALAPTVCEQKVTSTDARRAWAFLVRRLGEPAPGPFDLLLPPTPGALARTPSWLFHEANVERKRASTIVRAMLRSPRLEETTSMTIPDAYARLLAFPGVGPWTAAEVAEVALGDPDAVSVGDFHLKHHVCWALAGEARGTDERMLELLEPWRGHRQRVIRLIGRSGLRPPRFGPRLATRSIAAI